MCSSVVTFGIKMGLQKGALGLILILASVSAYVLLEGDDPEEKITWPTEYSFKAEEIDITSGKVENFEVWYSGENNRSRVDYYDGTYQKYYVGETEEDSGYEYRVFTMTDKNLHNEVVCERTPADELRNFLPKIDKYEYSGEIKLDGRQVKVWKVDKVMDQTIKIESTLNVYRTEYGFDVPVTRTVKSYELNKGAIAAYTITNYNSFGYTITLDDVELKDVDNCEFAMMTLGGSLESDLEFLRPHVPGDIDTAFHRFKHHHNKKYSGDEHEVRKAIFHQNWRRVVNHNRNKSSYKLELNQFADLTDEEFRRWTGAFPSDPRAVGSIPYPHSDEELTALEEDLPETYDMRLEGNLRPVQSQGICGSCWAFSTTAAVEGALSRANGGRNLDLSEQSLVDCAWGYENYGCKGGQLDKAFEYILQNQIPTEWEYGKYLQLDGVCHLENMTETFGIRGYSRVNSGSLTAMKVALVKYGPVAVAIYASSNLKLYSSGILYDFECDSSSRPDHGVVVVGYGQRDGTPYWVIRNSWGESWGEGGHVLLSAVNDNCMVLDNAFFPIV